MPEQRDTNPERVSRTRITDHLANERTFLAWVRTSIAIIGLGFVMAKFSVWLRQFLVTVVPGVRVPKSGASLPAGLALIALGALVAVASYRRYCATEDAIERGEYASSRALLIVVTSIVVVVSLAVVVYLIVTTADAPLAAR
jgi:putative membrane protein